MQEEGLLSPFWEEIDRWVSFAARYHDFEIAQSHQKGCMWEKGQCELRVYRMKHSVMQIVAHMTDGLLRSEFVILSCIPPDRSLASHEPNRYTFCLEGSVKGDKFVFSDESTFADLVLLFKTLLFSEAIVRICVDRGLSTFSTGREGWSTAILYKDKNSFSVKLRIDTSLPKAEEHLISVHFLESYRFSATVGRPSAAEPIHFSNTSDLIRFMERELDHPRLHFFGQWPI